MMTEKPIRATSLLEASNVLRKYRDRPDDLLDLCDDVDSHVERQHMCRRGRRVARLFRAMTLVVIDHELHRNPFLRTCSHD